MSLRNRLFLLSVFIFTIILFFPSQQALNFIATAIILGTSLFYNSFSEKKELFKKRIYISLMLLFSLLIFISVLMSHDQNRAFRYLDPRLPLLYFPLTIGLIRLENDIRTKALVGMAIIITAISSICLGYGIYRSFTLHNTAYLYNDALTEPITGIQSIYVSMLVNIAIYIFTWFLVYKSSARYKPALVLTLLLLFVISFLLASRNLMVVLYLSMLIFAFYYILKRKKYLEGFALVMALVIGGFLVVKFSPKTLNRFKELAYTKFNYEQTGPESHYDMAVDSTQWNGANTRLAIWQCGWQLFKQHPLLGVGLGDKKNRLMEVYKEKNFHFAIRTQKNLHSNYLDILVSLGIIGLILFLVGWIILPLGVAWQHRDGLSILIILTFAIAMITENYFDRSLGGMLFGFFVPFLLSNKPPKS